MVSKATRVADDKPGTSMIEQLLPEVTTYALSYLDIPSLCQLSMTSTSMMKAANDDSLWKSLYRQDFTEETNGLNPVNGWKAYYAATKAVRDVNDEFFSIIDSREIDRMTSIWLNSDYVKCCYGSGELVSGYDAVMQKWELYIDKDFGCYRYDPRDVQTRVLTSVAWVTTFAAHISGSYSHITNVFELHNGRWLMVHHQSSSSSIP
ncbi:PREDICTED: probable F-box protein At4g23960 [Camelina sativa]|uniref:Probable F-box protein At4g23960 n=1 Tax=Camelina sativa TaxID=90675 RepID=A0ABM0TZY6_CAMSA|nr:PREDICTED: probable F-box protein At4g23960 [Camelina sativa]